MGQYYKPVSLDRKQWLYSHSYDSGLKLMEHSWMRNDFVRAVVGLLIPGGSWHKTRIVWGGDYADNGAHITKRVQKSYKKWYRTHIRNTTAEYPDQGIPNLYDLGMDARETVKVEGVENKVKALKWDFMKVRRWWLRWLERKQLSPKWAFMEVHPATLTDAEAERFHFIVNHTKKEFVNLNTVPDNDGWSVHPLPLLTCSGNGRGGGDYCAEAGIEYVGTWAGNVISAEETAPNGYTQIKPDFKE